MDNKFFDISIAVVLLGASGCVLDHEEPEIGSNMDDVSFEEFVDRTFREPWEGGVYIVNGDTPIATLDELRAFYDELSSSGALAIHRNNGADSRWSDSQKRDLTYCVSDSFDSNKSTVVTALNTAASAWENAADVNFVHLTAHDSDCTSSNDSVVFDVRPVSNMSYLARAFFPHDSRSARNVLVDDSAFSSTWSLSGIMTHELGHALGFRHEHTRPESGQCFEDNNWRGLTPYDSNSVMHYPQCGGTGTALTMSSRDREGAADVYGVSPLARPGTPHLLVEFTGCVSNTPRYVITWWPSDAVPVTTYDVDWKRNSSSWNSLYNGTSSSVLYSGENGAQETIRVRACNVNGCSSFRSDHANSPTCWGGGGGTHPL